MPTVRRCQVREWLGLPTSPAGRRERIGRAEGSPRAVGWLISCRTGRNVHPSSGSAPVSVSCPLTSASASNSGVWKRKRALS